MKALPDFSAFQFTSEEAAGPTTREVRFIQKTSDIYNLVIEDVPEDEESPPGGENKNGDINGLMTTLILIIELYTERYPTRIIRLKGDTTEKARLYRKTLDKHVEALSSFFEIHLEKDRNFFRSFRQRDSLDNIAFLVRRKPGWSFTVHTLQTNRCSRSLLFDRAVSVEIQRSIEIGFEMIERHPQTS
jgi:hypothetical protein